MSSATPDERRAEAARELLSGEQFVARLRQSVQFRPRHGPGDTLGEAVEQIVRNPAFVQSRLLQRILVALTFGTGDFRVAEVSALDAPTAVLVMALAELRVAGERPESDWTDASATTAAACA